MNLQLLLFLMYCASLAYAGQLKPIGSLSTIVSDNYSDKKTEQIGSYYTVSYRDRHFIVTASHVSLGQILSPNVDILGRLSDVDNDLEIIEINKIEQTFASYHDLYLNNDSLQIKQNGLFVVNKIESKSKYQFIKSAHNTFSFVGPWVAEKFQAFTIKPDLLMSSYIQSDENGFFTTVGGNKFELFTPTNIKPGMSGGPLIINSTLPLLNSSGFILIGTASRYNRYYPGSIYSNQLALEQLLEKYIDGQRGYANSSRWVSENGIMYRKGEIITENFSCSTQDKAGAGAQGDGSLSNEFKTKNVISNSNCFGPGLFWKNNPIIGFINKDGATTYATYSSYLMLSTQNQIQSVINFDQHNPHILMNLLDSKLSNAKTSASYFCTVSKLSNNRISLKLNNLFDFKTRKFVHNMNIQFSLNPSKYNPHLIIRNSDKITFDLFVDVNGLFFNNITEYKTGMTDFNKKPFIRVSSLDGDFKDVFIPCSGALNE
ncbi:MAG: hypothetical protein ACK4VO_13220 [Pseudobdellovibrio sp.]